ncbi:MAG: hypothetical protein COW24_05245 [Candidatus Kerfeldbacteria bacterium CG15_BIG_FIL_POST_REV_8_21_14_020_45_12]|uniref:Uncharacterized protein n=2 Tax=Parcubacteria group TaxID=1794811 RepID=A0A2M7XD11_9BACT|nr:MAG: hypothetical protein COW24_05245 [Candidatus Kerfeldbacteria bacterium CG15_BIG_FIL_POST_REV_8_21_14_020_45_12]PJA45712.1 MAG: hypothetical protein CO174_01830 [Candidatus Uhrbacteria bacterium CG_4_9_14_3_um_filter_50_9]
MYKNLFFILLLIIAGVGTAFAFNRTELLLIQDTSPVSEDVVPTNLETDLYQEQNGIEITIERIEQREDVTVLTLGLSNHRFDLGQDVIYEQATLNGQASISHTIPTNAVGGHHVEAEVLFEKTTSGSLVLTPVEGTTFTFNNLW